MSGLKIAVKNTDHIPFRLVFISAGVLILTFLASNLGKLENFSLDSFKNRVASSFAKNTSVGLVSSFSFSSLLNKLEEGNLHSAVIGDITREFFSQPGKIVALSKDNIKVFEYTDTKELSKDVENFQKSARTREGAWKKSVHLYADSHMIVFYLGEKELIIKALDKIFNGEATISNLVISSVY